jgi:hypothetical protein
MLNRPLEAEELFAAAQRRTGLVDFGEPALAEPLQHVLDAIVRESALSTIGRFATRWDVLRFLCNLLRMKAAETRRPGILEEPIERPIFITGLPRSGTTFLHRLMLTDPAVHAPRVWETIYPYPSGKPPNRPRVTVARQLRAFERLAPEFRGLHPLDATSPQECSEITAHVFRSFRFDTNYRIPSYRAWLDAEHGRSLPAFRFHRRFLQHLQHRSLRPRGRWVLKCPEHVFTLDAIRWASPDARIVFVHRDPLRVLLSVAKLTEVLRRPFTRELNAAEIGRQESARWLEGTTRMIAASAEGGGFAEPICHVHHLDLVADPLAAIRGVYRHFGIDLPERSAARIGRIVAARPNGGYGPRDYRFADHGLDPAAEEEKFRPYMRRFDIGREPLPGRQAA